MFPASPSRMARAGALLLITSGLMHASQAIAAPQHKIAFVVDADGSGRTSRIFIANPDGSEMRPASPGLGRDRDPAFSPTGQSLAYQTNSQGGEQIMLTLVDGGGARVLVDGGSKPQWSRDGQRILFSRKFENKDRLFVIRADGKQKDRDLKPIAEGRMGRWSPDEKQLAVAATAIVSGAYHWQIRVVPTDAPETGPRKAVTLPQEWGPVLSLEWSPDANSLLFSVSRQGKNELYVLDVNSPEPRRVPAGDNPPNADHGVWSPDGKEILFRVSVDPSASAGAPSGSRLSVMKADGTGARLLWEPESKVARVLGTAWHRPPVQLAAAPPPMPQPPPVVEPPRPMPMPAVPPVTMPPAPAVQKVLGPPVKLHAQKLFKVQRQRSPVTVNVATPQVADFVINVPVLASSRYKKQRQGVGITLEMEDGSLYRGNVIFSGTPWITMQGRARGGKVRLIDGKQLTPDVAGFKKGFELGVRREGANFIITLNDEVQFSRPVLSGPVRQVSLTLENFDIADAQLPLGNIYYREWVQQAASTPQ